MSPATSAPGSAYLTGCGFVLSAGLVLSLGVLCIRGAGESEAFQYLFWRAMGFTAAVTLIAACRHIANPVEQVMRMGRYGWLAAATMVLSQVAFIAAIKVATVAEVFFLFSLAPLIAAVLAFPLLGERIGALGGLAVATAIGGVALMTGGGLHDGKWEGRALALGGALGFALYSLSLRRVPASDLDAVLVASGALTLLAAGSVVLLNGTPFLVPLGNIGLAMLHGGVILAVGLLLMGWASRSVPGVTLIMLAQSESIAAPVWSYLFLNETPARGVIFGGMLILSAVVLQAKDGARHNSAAVVAPLPTEKRPTLS
jgi:drug/metabolite transporter (DMT)-like permease